MYLYLSYTTYICLYHQYIGSAYILMVEVPRYNTNYELCDQWGDGHVY